MNLKPKLASLFATAKSIGINRVLHSEIEFSQIDAPERQFKTKGIWDTGASSTVITQEVFDHLLLKQVGVSRVSTATESNVLQPTYLVDVFLAREIKVQAVEVTIGKVAAEHGINCLIGSSGHN